MAKIYNDILLGEDGDLITRSGDFQTGNSIDQEIELVLSLNQGQLKSNPLVGVNLVSQMKGTGIDKVVRNIRLQLEADNKEVRKIQFESGLLTINASGR